MCSGVHLEDIVCVEMTADFQSRCRSDIFGLSIKVMTVWEFPIHLDLFFLSPCRQKVNSVWNLFYKNELKFSS